MSLDQNTTDKNAALALANVASLTANVYGATPTITWKHPNGDSEYVGDNVYNAIGGAVFSQPVSTSYQTNYIQIKAGLISLAGTVNIKIYCAPSSSIVNNVIPDSSWTILVPQFTATWGLSVDVFEVIYLASIITVPANNVLIVAFSTLTAQQVSIKRWDNNTPGNRVLFAYTQTTNYSTAFAQAWTISSSPTYCGVPLIASLVFPYAQQADMTTKLNAINTQLSTAVIAQSNGSFLGAYSPSTQYTHPRNPTELLGSSVYSAGYGVGFYEQLTQAIVVNNITVPVYASLDANITCRVYMSPLPLANPSTATFLEEMDYATGTFNTNSSNNLNIQLIGTYAIPANYYIFILFYKNSGTSISIKFWGALYGSAPERHHFVYLASSSGTPFNITWGQPSGSGGYYQTGIILNYISILEQSLQTQINTLNGNISTPYQPRITAPANIYVTVGMQLNLYYDAMILAGDKSLDSPIGCTVEVFCSKGGLYDRCWSYTPVSGDVGTYSLVIKTYNYAHVLITAKTVNLVVINTQPSSVKRILVIGDSTTSNGPVVQDIQSNFVSFGGSTPVFVGTQGTSPYNNEGRSGWTFQRFATNGGTFYRLIVSGVGSLSLGAIYSNNGSLWAIREIDVTSGSGYIKVEYSSGTNTVPLASGTFTFVSGTGGDATITYSSMTADTGNPFWNNSTSQLDITNYRQNTLGMGTTLIDVVQMRLGINESLTTIQSDTNRLQVIAYAQAICTAFLADNPACKILIQLPTTCANDKGGWGTQYGATGYREEYIANVWRLREFIISTFDNGAYSSNVFVGNTGLTVDRWYGYDLVSRSAGVHFTQTDLTHSNAVHPGVPGYQQIADTEFSNLLNLCI